MMAILGEPRRAFGIVHVAAAGPYGGLESVLAQLAAGLTRRGCALHVVAIFDLEPDPHPFQETLVAAGVQMIPIRLRARAYWRERQLLRQTLRTLRPQVVHTHGYRADVQAGAVARGLEISTISTVHGFTGGDWKNQAYERLQLRSLRRADAVVAVSRPLIDRLNAAHIPPDRLHLLPNAWGGRGRTMDRAEARRELGLSPDDYVVGWVGRLSFEKGADVLLDALARLPRIVACVIGDGPERTALAVRARALGVDERVVWTGARPDAGRLFNAFDAFALSSRTEGTPMVLFEAMDAGVPVAATAVGGVPDVVGPAHAWLLPPEDPAALAHALAEIHSDPRESVRRATAARSQLIERFGLEAWLDAHESLYRSLNAVSQPRVQSRSS